MEHIKSLIKKQLKNNKTIIYIKGSPSSPLCGFSASAVNILNKINIIYSFIDILQNPDIRKILPLYSNWPTFPQLFYKQNLIGGSDIILQLYKENKLKDILTK